MQSTNKFWSKDTLVRPNRNKSSPIYAVISEIKVAKAFLKGKDLQDSSFTFREFDNKTTIISCHNIKYYEKAGVIMPWVLKHLCRTVP
ncbi:hypothetical protein M0802_014393 [Mischocyttarus mexicanus]|nr:hypothetical protein M0802_014393 [Mischocyttarus mexicanus]